MINGADTRRLYESFATGGSQDSLGRSGPEGFVSHLMECMGYSQDELGRPVISDRAADGTPRLRPEEFGLRDLAESIVGPDWVNALNPAQDQSRGHEVLEAGAVLPGSFANISAYNSTVGGLLEVKVLEAYRKPKFVGDLLVRNIPTNQRGEKLPGHGRVGDKAETMNPGQVHPRVQFAERWVQTPDTEKRGLGIDVTKEAVFFDLTNMILAHAESIGDELGLRKEKLILDVVMGNTNNYDYNGTSYNTFLTSGNWINDHSNPLVDWTDLDASEQLFADMTDQEEGERITVEPDTILVMPYKKRTAFHITNATEIENRTNSAAEVRSGITNQDANLTVISSAIAYQRLTDTDGGGLAAAAAREYWFHMEAKKAFGYTENWAMNVQRASASDYQMLDSGLVLSVFADEMGIPFVLEPRYCTRNKN